MTIKTNKPDLLTVLNRRNFSVEKFLIKSGVESSENVGEILEKLKSHYFVSDEFVKQSLALFSKKKPNKNKITDVETVVEPQKDPQTEPKVVETPKKQTKKVKTRTSTKKPRTSTKRKTTSNKKNETTDD